MTFPRTQHLFAPKSWNSSVKSASAALSSMVRRSACKSGLVLFPSMIILDQVDYKRLGGGFEHAALFLGSGIKMVSSSDQMVGRPRQMPVELWQEILSYCNYYELLRAGSVCRVVSRIVRSFRFALPAPEWMISIHRNTDSLFRIDGPLGVLSCGPLALTLPLYCYTPQASVSVPRSGTGYRCQFERETLYRHNQTTETCFSCKEEKPVLIPKCPCFCATSTCYNAKATRCAAASCATCCFLNASCTGHARSRKKRRQRDRRSGYLVDTQ